MISFTIPLVPIAKGRPKFARMGKFVKVYTPAKTKSYEDLVAHYGKLAMAGQKPLEGALHVHYMFVMPIPKSLSKKKQDALLNSWHSKKPDIDNLMKSTEDGLNGIAWIDDSQICSCMALKFYGSIPQVIIKITQL